MNIKKLFVSLAILSAHGLFAQVYLTVYSRGEVSHGNWDWGYGPGSPSDPTSPWWGCGDIRSRPDVNAVNWNCGGVAVTEARNNLEFGHNNNLSQTVNGSSWYNINQLTFNSATSSNRSFAPDATAGISLHAGIFNHGSGTMTFDVPIGVDANATFQNTNAGTGGQLTFTDPIYVNDKTLTLIPQASGSTSSYITFGAGCNVSNGSGSGAKIIVSGTSATVKALEIEGTVNYAGIFQIDDGQVVISSGAVVGGAGTNLDLEVRGGVLDIYEDITVKDLYILGGSIEVHSGGSLTVLGNIYHTAGASSGTVNLYATSPTAPGQLKVLGGIYEDNPGTTPYDNGIHFKVHQKMNISGHHAVASPFSEGFNSSKFSTAGIDVTKLYGFDEAGGQYLAAGSNLTDVGRGFFAPIQSSGGFFTAGSSFIHQGSPNTAANVTLKHSATTQAGGSGDHWNLIGNPYTCALDFASINLGSYVNAACYLWDANTMKYDYYVNNIAAPSSYVGSQILTPVILPYHGFWVQLNGTSPSLADVTLSTTMASNGVISSNGSTFFYKNNPDNLILIAHEVGDSSKSDVMWLKNVAGTTLGFEGAEDAWKLTNYGGQPMIYSVHADEELAINAVDLSAPSAVPVGFKAPQQGVKYQIELEQVVNAGAYTAYLEDKLLGTFNDLSQQPYTFIHQGWNSESPRFALHVSQSSMELNEETIEGLIAYQDGSRLMVDSDVDGTIHLIALDGRIVFSESASKGLNSYDLNGVSANGIYILQLQGENPASVKVVLNTK